jgi:hypothetical protein
MKMSIEVEQSDGSSVVASVITLDLVRFEQQFDKSVGQFASDMKLSDICWLAWHALERTKQTAKSFDEWLENVEMVSLSNEPDPVPLESKA